MRTRQMDNPILVKTVDVGPFPVEVLPEWISEYVNGLSKELNTMVDLPVCAALSVLAAALSGKVLFIHNNWILNVNLYQVLAALPASKKDAIINRTFKELHLIRKQ